jgi:D-proline reductase (dithiol) PrdB
VELIENLEEWRRSYKQWTERQGSNGKDELGNYPFVKNKRAPFVALRSALPMLNLALITTAGAYIDGTDPFNTSRHEGDLSFREIPTEIEAEDLKFSARGYSTEAINQDINSQIPLERLYEFEANGIIGHFNQVFWSLCGYIPDGAGFAETAVPKLIERLKRYEVRAAILIPASRLCHQTVGIAARALEMADIPSMVIGVDAGVIESVKPPRAVYYEGKMGSIAGQPNWPEHQRRVLDETLRLLEPLEQPTIRKLVVTLETEVEQQRGEK